MYLHSATSPEKKIVVLYVLVKWRGQSPHPTPISTFVSYVHAHPDIPEQHSYLSADMIMARTHLTVVVSLVQFYAVAFFLPFWSSLSFSADEKKATPRDAVPAELRSVS